MKASDMELLRAWRDGDDRAGNSLFSRYFDQLNDFFSSKVGHDDVDDLIQQTMLVCVRNRDGFRGDATFRTYLFTAARSRLIDHYRRVGRRPAHQTGSNAQAPEPTPSTWMGSRERTQALLDSLAELKLEYQLVLEMYYVRGFRGPELATILEIPESTVRSRLRRALAELGRQMHSHATGDLRIVACDALEGWAEAVREAANHWDPSEPNTARRSVTPER